jgi:hypothetical protein
MAPAADHHHQHGDDHGGDHHRQMVGHADRRNHRVQREHDVQHHDLRDDGGERSHLLRAILVLLALEVVMDLDGGLAQQEQAADDQHEVARGDGVAAHREQLGGQVREPGKRGQQQDAGRHGCGQPQRAGAGALRLGKPAGEDRDEDDVVDAQDDFQAGEGQQGDPGLGVGDPLHRAVPRESVGDGSVPARAAGCLRHRHPSISRQCCKERPYRASMNPTPTRLTFRS